jgi:hypothetical protein
MPQSVLNRQQSDKFIDLVVDQSVLLKEIRQVRVNGPKGDINRLDLGHIVSHGASARTTPKIQSVKESTIEWDTEKYQSAFDVGEDFLYDNIEGQSAADTLMRMFAKQIATNNALALLNYDTSIPVGDDETDEANLYGVNDGILKILRGNVPTAQQLDAGGKSVSAKLFYTAKALIPSKYQVAEPDYKWLCSTSVHDKWVYSFATRLTDGGDSALSNGVAPRALGIPLLKVPLMPTTLSATGVLGGGNRTAMILTPPKNIVWFIQRDFKVEIERKPRRDLTEVTMHWKVDFQIENPDLVVLVDNIDVASATDY